MYQFHYRHKNDFSDKVTSFIVLTNVTRHSIKDCDYMTLDTILSILSKQY